MSVPEWLEAFDLGLVRRVDIGLEGDWSATVVTVWSPEGGARGLERVPVEHPRHRHAVELYLADGWIGIHCFERVGDVHRLDRRKAEALVSMVERARREDGADGA